MRSPDHPLHDAAMDALCRSMLAAGHCEADIRLACVHALERFRWEEEFQREALAERAEQEEFERALGLDYEAPAVLRMLQQRWEDEDPDWRELPSPSGDRPDDDACIYPHWLPDLRPQERAYYLGGENEVHLDLMRALFPRVDEADWSTLRVMTQIELERSDRLQEAS